MSTAFSASSGSSSDAVNADTSTLHSINIIIYWRAQNETEIENVLQFDACNDTEEEKVESAKPRMQTAAQVCSILSSLCNYAYIFHISFILLLFRWCRIRRYTVGTIFRSQLCCFSWARWKWHNGRWNAHHNVEAIIPIFAFRHSAYIQIDSTDTHFKRILFDPQCDGFYSIRLRAHGNDVKTTTI